MPMRKRVIRVEGRISEQQTCYTIRGADRQLRFDFAGSVPPVNGFRDPAFSENKTQPLHRWVPWIAGFSAQFVQDCFETFLRDRRKQTPCILDPFAGVGTTLVQALLNGFDCVGFEINPYAALACKVKLNAPKIDLTVLEEVCAAYEKFARTPQHSTTERGPPGFQSRIPFFSPSVQEQVLAFLEFARRISQPDVADLFRLAFGSVMISFSKYTYEPSLGSRPGAGKPLVEQANVHYIISRKLSEMVSDIRWVKERLVTFPNVTASIYNRDFLQSEDVLPPSSVNLVVTSPPYMNNYHYVRNTRPQLFWLSLISSTEELRRLETLNFGKYWQTVRNAKMLDLEFEHHELSKTLMTLRHTRPDKGPYGGPGWANYVVAYFNDCYRFRRVLKRVLMRSGVAVIVVGNSIIQGHEIRTDLILADIARQCGFSPVGVQQIRSKRVGASITKSHVRRGAQNGATLYDSAVIIKKN